MEAKKKFIINVAFYGILFVVLAATYKYILPIMVPFIIGFCVAAIVQLPLKRMNLRSPRQRKLWASVFCVAFYAAVIGLLTLFGISVATEIGSFVKTLPDLVQTHLYPFFTYAAQQVEEILNPIDPSLTAWIIEAGKTAAQSLGQFATDFSAGAVKFVASGAVSIPGVLVQIIITLVSSFYIAADYDLVISFLKSLIPQSKRHYTIDVLRYARTAVLAFIKSYSIMFLVTFLELWIGMSLLQVPYPLGVAFGIALFDLMPVLGTGGILLPWAVIALVMGNYVMAVGVALLYVVIAIVRNSLEPRIVGNQIGLHPLATLVAMILGLNLMGLIGMLLFPILLVAVTNLKKARAQSAQSE